MHKNAAHVFIDERRILGRVPKKYNGTVIIKARTRGDAKPVLIPCPFCKSELGLEGDASCPECESDFIYRRSGEEVIVMTTRNTENPVI
jgi:Zn finger protein HypA/HybF involved in hydrogenase expression